MRLGQLKAKVIPHFSITFNAGPSEQGLWCAQDLCTVCRRAHRKDHRVSVTAQARRLDKRRSFLYGCVGSNVSSHLPTELLDRHLLWRMIDPIIRIRLGKLLVPGFPGVGRLESSVASTCVGGEDAGTH